MARPENLKTYTTLTQIGLTFGVSAQQVGKVLTEQGYREAKTLNPTPKATDSKLAIASNIPTGQRFWMWKAKDIAAVLENLGWVKLPAEDVRAAAVTFDTVKLLKHTSNIRYGNGEKAWKIVERFAPCAKSQHLKMLLESIEKTNKTVFPVFQKQYEDMVLQKKIHENLCQIGCVGVESEKSKM